MAKGKGGDNAGAEGGDKNKIGSNEIEIVLKLNLHCEGCCKKIRKSIIRFPGVRTVDFEGENKAKIIAERSVKPQDLRTRIEKKTRKSVEILSPLPKKEEKEKPPKSENDQFKEKEQPVTTVVLKVAWHCEGCGERLHKAISSYTGVYEVTVDKEKDLVTVKGKMDSKKMVEDLREKLRKPVEIVPEKKDQKEKKQGNGAKGDNKKENEEGITKGSDKGDKILIVDHFVVTGSGYFYKDESGQLVYPFYNPQLFSDENANGCSIM